VWRALRGDANGSAQDFDAQLRRPAIVYVLDDRCRRVELVRVARAQERQQENRWGQTVFESHDINTGWDGTFKALPQEIDVYVWVIRYTDPFDGKEVLLKGNVNLIR